jgi:hypothetical protein
MRRGYIARTLLKTVVERQSAVPEADMASPTKIYKYR